MPASQTQSPTEKRIPIPVHRAQLDFLRSNARYKGYVGGRGAGKTFICAYDLIKRALPGRFYTVVSPTFSQDVKDVTYPTFLEVCEKLNLKTKIRKTDFRGTFQTLQGGHARIVFKSAEDPDRLRGPNVTGLWLDEASLMVEQIYKIGIAGMREDGEAGWMIAGFTPKGRSHWTYDVFTEKKHDVFLVHSRTKQNVFASDVFVDSVTEIYGETILAAQELEGQFVEAEGQLIRYDWILSCQSDCLWPGGVPPAGFKGYLYVGIDIGRTRDRTVIWTWEKQNDLCLCREIKVLHDVPFAEQRVEIDRRLNNHVVKCRIDAGGIGKPLAEDLERDYPGVVEGMTLGVDAQKKLSERLRVGFETRAVRIPSDQDLRDDLQLVTIGKMGTVETGRSSTVGHADRFWASAMGYDVAATEVDIPDFSRPRGFPARTKPRSTRLESWARRM